MFDLALIESLLPEDDRRDLFGGALPGLLGRRPGRSTRPHGSREPVWGATVFSLPQTMPDCLGVLMHVACHRHGTAVRGFCHEGWVRGQVPRPKSGAAGWH